MIACVVSNFEGVATYAWLAITTSFVRCHRGVVPNLLSFVEESLNRCWKMRNNISIVDHSVHGHHWFVELGELFVSYSRLAIVIETVNSSMNLMNLDSSKGSKCSSKTMPSNIYWCTSMELPQVLDVLHDSGFGHIPSAIKSIVNLAIAALGICHLVEWEIRNPVGNVARSSKGKYDSFDSWRISREPLKISSFIVVCLDILHVVWMAVSARPRIDGGDRLIGNRWHVCELFGNVRLIGWLRHEYERKNDH